MEVPKKLEPDLPFTIRTRQSDRTRLTKKYNEEWIDDRSKPEVEIDYKQQQSYEQDLTNLRVLEWLKEMTSDPKETSVTIHDVDRESMKHIKT